MIITIQKQQRRWQSGDLVPDNSSSHSACLPVEGGWGWVGRQWDGGLGIKGLALPEGMAGVQIGTRVNDYQVLLYVCLYKGTVEVPLVRWLVGLWLPSTFYAREHTHAAQIEIDGKFCRLRNTDPPTTNRSKPKRSFTTSHSATPPSPVPHTLDPQTYTHKNSETTACCSSFLSGEAVNLSANENQH